MSKAKRVTKSVTPPAVPDEMAEDETYKISGPYKTRALAIAAAGVQCLTDKDFESVLEGLRLLSKHVAQQHVDGKHARLGFNSVGDHLLHIDDVIARLTKAKDAHRLALSESNFTPRDRYGKTRRQNEPWRFTDRLP